MSEGEGSREGCNKHVSIQVGMLRIMKEEGMVVLMEERGWGCF